jgi:lipoprotein-anchoring transpeptidase ErfK/SrfK
MRTRTPFPMLLSGAFAALLCAASGLATAQTRYENDAPQDAGVQPVDPDGLSLRAGQFAWLPGADTAGDGPVAMLVNLSAQRAYLYRNGRRIAVTTVSTGRPGHDTPTGVFPILGKERMHHSNRYDNAPMPWMQRLTQWGHALHAGNVRPYPASHGCVRLPAEFARQLYSLTQPGDLVIISQDDTPRSIAIALAVAGMDDQTALQVGVTEPLPRIVFVRDGQRTAHETPTQTGGSNQTAF